ncbi:MAG: CTP-dependent riboflavin kinase [Methanosphaera sp.]|uniref:DUF120 domain-containing protein n=1 Tax=Methanosphaera sp. ISO3-F5 TaxID=1452353 RepID=UPI002B260ED6|nr:DUF120 domain-containing protein [Methanosphaera sp. ISO3-F5]MBR0472072.1 CTP-dependent riboflavin kinase [Methanosphaera sp.]WQH65095.1 CTP-dependent riboflavin kinase [Methanosphaera sp. ISO3-F5]
MINFEGKVTSGLGKAGNFMQKDTYKKQYKNKLGFEPYPGTLNIKLNKDIEINLKEEYNNELKIIEGDENLGDVYFLKARISDLKKISSKKGAILFPTKTVHKFNTIEFIADEKLRDTMELKDNSKVNITINENYEK